MSSRSPKPIALLLLALCTVTVLAAAPLRICADPDNLPFSNRTGAGFDDQIATLIVRDLHRDAIFIWARPRRGFLREQFNKNACDILLGVPTGMHSLAVTVPYYTSSYIFITPAREHLQIASFTDDKLNNRRIGLQILEEDLSPPSLPLIRAGHAAQIVGYESFGSQEGDVVRAVATGKVGVAVVWGPVAGYFARNTRTPLTLEPLPPSYRFAGIPFTYSIGLGVHRQDATLLQQLNRSILKLQPQIKHILASFSIPTVDMNKEAH